MTKNSTKVIDIKIPKPDDKYQVATFTIQKAKSLNALDLEVLSQLKSALKDLESLKVKRPEIFGLVLEGEGDKAFVAGADIRYMQSASNAQLEEFSQLAYELFTALESSSLITIAAVDGFALGGGMELALACDFIVASERAKFGQPEVNLGLIPGFGGTQRLSQRVGIGRCKRLIFTGETIDCKTAESIGLIDFSGQEIKSAVENVLALLASKSSVSLAAAKRSIDSYYKSNRVSGL